MDNNESQVRTISEIFGCSRNVAKEMLMKCDWDINKVLDKCESGMELEIEASSSSKATENVGGISSVLKRKKYVEEPEVIIIDENEKKKAKEDDEEEPSIGPTTEPCPVCSAPNFLPDRGLARYNCVECGTDTCRLCYMQAHGEGQECVIEGFKKITVLPSRNFDAENDLDREFRIAEGQFLRMMSNGKNYEIKSIEIVKNDKLEKKFNAKKQEFKELGIDDKPLLIFHGTPVKNIEAILRHNFDLSKVSNGRKFGDGVYFSEKPEVSVRYTRDWKPNLSLILCLVLKGTNSKEVTSSGTSVDTEEMSKGAWAIVVPDTDQILPKYVINFKEVVERSNMPHSNFPRSIRHTRFGGHSGKGHGYVNLNPVYFPPATYAASAHLGNTSYKECKRQKKASACNSQQGQAVPPPTLVLAPEQVQTPAPSTAQAVPADPHQLMQQFPTLIEDLKKLQKMLQSPVFQQAMNMTLSTQDPQDSAAPSVQEEVVKTNASVSKVEVEVIEKTAANEDVDITDDSTESVGVESGKDHCIDGSADEAASRDFIMKVDDPLVPSRDRVRREDGIGGVVQEIDEGSANTGTDDDDCVGKDFLIKIGDVWLASREEDQDGI